MNIKQAKLDLKKKGTVTLYGVTITEAKQMQGNWQVYAGKYRVYANGGAVEETYYDTVGITQAFNIARKYLQVKAK